MIERTIALYRDLVRRDSPLKEVSELLHALQLHEGGRIVGFEALGQAKRRQSLIGYVREILPHLPARRTHHESTTEYLFGGRGERGEEPIS